MANGACVQPLDKGGQWLLRMAEEARHATLELLEASQVRHTLVANPLWAGGWHACKGVDEC